MYLYEHVHMYILQVVEGQKLYLTLHMSEVRNVSCSVYFHTYLYIIVKVMIGYNVFIYSHSVTYVA